MPCWICGAPANSKEHRLKKSDIVRAYGRGGYKGQKRPVHVKNGQVSSFQGPSAERLKYAPSLCHECNTTRTQPFDKAYDQLISWVLENEDEVLRTRKVDFARVYGEQCRENQIQLYKYFVKSFGCRLVDAGFEVPENLVKLFPLDEFTSNLCITFLVHEDVLVMPAEDRYGFIGKSDLVVSDAASGSSTLQGFEHSEHVSWFFTQYWYEIPQASILGTVWVPGSRQIELSSLRVLSDDERAELRRGFSE